MSIQLQAKLLRVLEDSEVEVIGENIPKKLMLESSPQRIRI